VGKAPRRCGSDATASVADDAAAIATPPTDDVTSIAQPPATAEAAEAAVHAEALVAHALAAA
jgi:hypothetical protein